MASRISKDGLWRVTYGEIPGLSRDELLARQPAKFEAFLPGHPKPDGYKIASINPYKCHQRLAEKMAVGRFALAADAAHRECLRFRLKLTSKADMTISVQSFRRPRPDRWHSRCWRAIRLSRWHIR